MSDTTRPEYRCAVCGGLPRGDSDFDCGLCGRPLGICSNPQCGWGLRLFKADDPKDCEACGYAPMTPEEEARTRPQIERLAASIGRVFEEVAQMQARSGPYYDLAKERSRIVNAAYRAAGSPRKIGARMMYNPTRIVPVFVIRSGKSDEDTELATQADVDAWHAWVRQRDRLRRELGVKRGQGRPVTASGASETTDD